jgi:NAD(P)-dependent dehydrogenase (short-subunit alcohol dehydrogenase family)
MSDQNPITAQPQPPFPEQEQEPMGLESEMDPKPDYGEQTYRGFGRLDGKVALITGGDSGIGRAVALAYAREGADVLISYFDEHSDAEETVRVVEAAGRRAVAVPGDIGEESLCQQLVGRAVDELGGLDILVANAAYQQSHDSVTEIPSDEFERIYRTNVFATFYLIKAAVPVMKPGSSIIITTSIQAANPSPQLLHYASTKAALVAMTKALGQELAPQGIRVNSVAPGPVWTPLIAMSFPADSNAHFGENSPMQRPAMPAELAPAYVFLASDESRYMAGAVVPVTGGEPF